MLECAYEQVISVSILKSHSQQEWRSCAASGQLWETLDLSGHQNAGELLLRASASPQLRQHLLHANLEFAAGIEDSYLPALHVFKLESLNLNGCQQ